MNLVVWILSCVGGAVGGGGASGTCPAACRCDGAGGPRDVDCVDAGLRSVPSNLSGFTSSLDLSVNRLSALSSHVFAGLPRLHELRLTGNGLSTIGKDAFAGLAALRLLNLRNNRLRRVPPGAFKNLRNLRSLRLDANFIPRLPASAFTGLTSLRHLWLEDNALTEVPVLALSPLAELRALTLALNSIADVPDRAFATLGRLLVLHLHGNRIRSLGRDSFAGLDELENLDLSDNRIHSFPAAVESLISLRRVNLQNNIIAVVPVDVFCRSSSLETIDVRNNPLRAAGHGTRPLTGHRVAEPWDSTDDLETRGSEPRSDFQTGSTGLQDAVDRERGLGPVKWAVRCCPAASPAPSPTGLVCLLLSGTVWFWFFAS